MEKNPVGYGCIVELPIDEIKPNPYGQRRHFDFYSLNILADSIRKYGVIQPVTVRYVNGGNYETISGERRIRAAETAGLKTIPAVIVEASEEESALTAFTENLQRHNLTFTEVAEGCRALMHDFGMSIAEISAKTGMSRSMVKSRLKMLDMPEEALKIIAENHISEDIANVVGRLNDDELIISVINDIVEQNMNLKMAEDYIERLMYCEKFSEQKVKSTFSDMKLFTNSIRRIVETVRKAGITAYYDVFEAENGLEIKIKLIGDLPKGGKAV